MAVRSHTSLFGIHLQRATLNLFVGKHAEVKTNPPLFTDPRSIAGRVVVLFSADDFHRREKGVIGVAHRHGRRHYRLEAQRVLDANELRAMDIIEPA